MGVERSMRGEKSVPSVSARTCTSVVACKCDVVVTVYKSEYVNIILVYVSGHSVHMLHFMVHSTYIHTYTVNAEHIGLHIVVWFIRGNCTIICLRRIAAAARD